MTPEERLPHYNALFKEWTEGGYWDDSGWDTQEEDLAHLDRIRANVLLGL